MTQPYSIEFASAEYQSWLAALKDRAMLQTHNQAQAMFRSVIHCLRRHMSTDAVLDFADALPPLPRGIFLAGWRPAEPQPLPTVEAFVAGILVDLAPHHVPPETIAADVFAVLADKSTSQAAAVMRSSLPDTLKGLWPEPSPQ